MSLVQFYPPVALATVLFAFWALVLYRLYKRDPIGDESFAQIAWLGIPIVGLGLFLWLHGFEEPLESHFQLVVGTLFGISFGCAVVFAINVAMSREGTIGQKWYARIGAIALLFMLSAGFFI